MCSCVTFVQQSWSDSANTRSQRPYLSETQDLGLIQIQILQMMNTIICALIQTLGFGMLKLSNQALNAHLTFRVA